MTPTTRKAPVARPTLARGTRRDAHPAAALIGTAFHDLKVAAWLVPDPVERPRALYALFRILVEHACDHGSVSFAHHQAGDRAADRAGDRSGYRAGVAVWFPRDRPLPEIADYDRRLWLACGPSLKRFQALDAAFDKHHPDEAHHHLAFLAVHPDHQGHGIGTALLGHYHARLDRAGIPAYLEASSPRSRALYLRHGYHDRGTPIELPGTGPRLWPMWRTPRHPPEPGGDQ